MRVKCNTDVLFHNFGTEGVLLDQDNEVFLSLNETALRMWELLYAGDRSLPQIAKDLAGEFDAPEDELLRDLEQFVADLEARHIVTVAPV